MKRHANSIDTSKKVCGSCQSSLLFLGRFKADGTPAAKRGASQFSLFVKSNFIAVKQQFPNGRHPRPISVHSHSDISGYLNRAVSEVMMQS